MLIHSETEMLQFGEQFGKKLSAPTVIELAGDVGAGKTTFVRGLAKGLAVAEEITSPSFTISKEYQGEKYRLVHYDFYRLPDPGIMSEDLAEAINDQNTITVIEWGDSIQDVLPAQCKRIKINYLDENQRELIEL